MVERFVDRSIDKFPFSLCSNDTSRQSQSLLFDCKIFGSSEIGSVIRLFHQSFEFEQKPPPERCYENVTTPAQFGAKKLCDVPKHVLCTFRITN